MRTSIYVPSKQPTIVASDCAFNALGGQSHPRPSRPSLPRHRSKGPRQGDGGIVCGLYSLGHPSLRHVSTRRQCLISGRHQGIVNRSLNGTGQASYSTATLTVGSRSVTAKYLGTAGDKPPTSSAVTVVIKGIPATKLFTTSLSFRNPTIKVKSTAKPLKVTNSGSATARSFLNHFGGQPSR